MNVEEWRLDFPLLEQVAYLNNAATGIIPTPTREIIANYLEQRTCTFPLDLEPMVKEGWVQPVTQLLNAEPEEIISTRATSEGLSRVLYGLNWEKTDNIVTCDLEYPAVVIPLFQIQRKTGIEIRMAKHVNGEYPIDSVVRLIDDNTRAVVLSQVEWLGGWRHDLAQISKKAKQHGALMIVDPIQALGAFEMDVKKMGIDALAAQGMKWLIAPLGTGLMYIKRELIEEITPAHTGVGSLDNQKELWDLIEREILPMERIQTWPLRTDIRKFQLSAPNFMGLLALGRSIQYLLGVGIRNTRERILNLSGYLIDILSENDYRVFGPTDRAHRSGIICFPAKYQDPSEICKELRKRNICISARGGMLRISPHFYNTEDDIDRCFEAILELDKT